MFRYMLYFELRNKSRGNKILKNEYRDGVTRIFKILFLRRFVIQSAIFFHMDTLIKYLIIFGIIATVVFFVSRANLSSRFLYKEVAEKPESSKGEVAVDKATLAELHTNKGIITIELFSADAPKTVKNFITLAESGFYNGTTFHRVIKDFMIQGGDPLSKDTNWADDGTGGPGYTFEDEINQHKVVRGVLAMANTGPNTNGSQFFIVTATEASWLDGKHTVFGRVVEGMDVVGVISSISTNENDHPRENVVVEKIVIHK